MTWLRKRATSTRAASTVVCAWRSTRLDAAPRSKRRCVRLKVSVSLASVPCASLSRSWSAASVKYALATSATRLMCVLRRASAVAKYCSSACWLRLRMRPKKSSSYAAKPMLAAYWWLVKALPVVLVVSGTRWCVPLPVALIAGNSSARWIW